MRRLAVRANGPDAAALMRASCARTRVLRLRHGAPDWEPPPAGWEVLGREGPASSGPLRTRRSASLPTFDFRPSTFPVFPCRRAAFPICRGAATDRAAGLAAHEARFGAAADTPLNARRASLTVSKVRRGSATSNPVNPVNPVK